MHKDRFRSLHTILCWTEKTTNFNSKFQIHVRIASHVLLFQIKSLYSLKREIRINKYKSVLNKHSGMRLRNNYYPPKEICNVKWNKVVVWVSE